ncbi:MAG: 6-pyruvoyl tetrahydropterin synthase family protein [Gemmatimonadales bacterium]
MSNVLLTRVVKFSAAHRYFRPDWSTDRNLKEFGACASEHGHGHSYECRITVSGSPSDETSMVADLAHLDAAIQQEVVQRFDHRHINYDVPEFAFGKQIPTVEALAVFIWNKMVDRMPPSVKLECVRIQEEPCLYAEYHGAGP